MTAWQNAATARTGAVRVFLAGPTGTGKTSAAATFPRPLFIFPANEDSWKSLIGRDVPYATVANMAETNAIIEELKLAHQSGSLGNYGETIVFDALSHYSELIEREVTRDGARRMEHLDWGRYLNHFMRIRDALWGLPVHVVMTALTKRSVDREGITTAHGIRLYGQAAELLASSFDMLGLCEQIPAKSPIWRTHFCTRDMFPGRTRLAGMTQGEYLNFNFVEHIAPHLT